MNTRIAHTLQATLPIIGLVAVWLSVLNRLLYPSKHTLYHLSAEMDGFVQAVYAVAFALAALVIVLAIKQPERTLVYRSKTVAALGMGATAGVLLPVPFADGTGMAIAAVVVGALLIAAYISSHFMYWTIRGAALSVRYMGLALAFSLVGFFVLDLVFTLAGVHSIAAAAACPLVSTGCVLLASTTDGILSARDTDAGQAATAALPTEHQAQEPEPAHPGFAGGQTYGGNVQPDSRERGKGSDLTTVISKMSEEFDLSKREAELVELAYRNLSARKIAEKLFIAESTVYTHLKRIYRKTGVHSKQELIDLIDTYRV